MSGRYVPVRISRRLLLLLLGGDLDQSNSCQRRESCANLDHRTDTWRAVLTHNRLQVLLAPLLPIPIRAGDRAGCDLFGLVDCLFLQALAAVIHYSGARSSWGAAGFLRQPRPKSPVCGGGGGGRGGSSLGASAMLGDWDGDWVSGCGRFGCEGVTSRSRQQTDGLRAGHSLLHHESSSACGSPDGSLRYRQSGRCQVRSGRSPEQRTQKAKRQATAAE